MAGAPVTQFVFNRDVVDGYNQRYDELKDQLRTLVHNRGRFESAYLVPLFAIRLCTVIAAATSGFFTTCLVSLLQFVVAPYSFFAAFAAWLGVVPFYVIHFASFAGLQLATGTVYSTYPVLGSYLTVPITPPLIVGWVVVDQLICLTLCVWTQLPVLFGVHLGGLCNQLAMASSTARRTG